MKRTLCEKVHYSGSRENFGNDAIKFQRLAFRCCFFSFFFADPKAPFLECILDMNNKKDTHPDVFPKFWVVNLLLELMLQINRHIFHSKQFHFVHWLEVKMLYFQAMILWIDSSPSSKPKIYSILPHQRFRIFPIMVSAAYPTLVWPHF